MAAREPRGNCLVGVCFGCGWHLATDCDTALKCNGVGDGGELGQCNIGLVGFGVLGKQCAQYALAVDTASLGVFVDGGVAVVGLGVCRGDVVRPAVVGQYGAVAVHSVAQPD